MVNRTNFWLLRSEFLQKYVEWGQRNNGAEPMEDNQFVKRMLELFAEHKFFSREMYNMYQQRYKEVNPDLEYTTELHTALAKLTMKNWKDEILKILKDGSEFFRKMGY